MGDSLGKVKKGVRKLPVAQAFEKGHKALGKAIDTPFRKGTSSARRDAAAATAKQMQMEQVKLADAESEIAKKQASAGSKAAGRKSLIKSSGGGLAQNLGGTV